MGKYLLIILLILVVFMIVIIVVDSNRFVVREYTIKSRKIKEPVDFLFVSDLHCKEYGRDNEKLFKVIDSLHADYALVGGDIMVGKRGKKQDKGVHFINELSKRMPVYHALGNHEQRAKIHPDIYGRMYSLYERAVSCDNVKILDNESVTVGNVRVYGFTMDEKFYVRRKRQKMDTSDIYSKLGEPNKELFNIMLAHDPEYFEAYSEADISLVLSGHFHGGIARLPFVGGVISPRFLLFPGYTGGMYKRGDVTMIVSCGLGMHSIPLRFNNPAELSLVHLKND